MSRKRVAVFGGSFNPPGLHHRGIVEVLSQKFDQVVVVPCGPRPDKSVTQSIDSRHKATMVDMAFAGIPNVRVDLFDLEKNTFTRTNVLDTMYQTEGDVWHVVGVDLLIGGAQKKSLIHREWELGDHVWNSFNFVVFPRAGYTFDRADLPPHSLYMDVADTLGSSSSEIRRLLHGGREVAHLLPQDVSAYIQRFGLYQQKPADEVPLYSTESPVRAQFVFEHANERAVALYQHYKKFEDTQNPSVIVVLGGDGVMLHALRTYWRKRLPFYGINLGRRGFLLNPISQADAFFAGRELLVHHLPMLLVKSRVPEVAWYETFVVNDVCLERSTGQTARISIEINDRVKIPELFADGVLISTPQGSTAYAMSMGATPLPVDTEKLLLVGSNVAYPPRWKQAILSLRDTVTCRVVDTDKRPCRVLVDGEESGIVTEMRVRTSRIASVQVLFDPQYNLAAKLAEIQFPSP